MRRVLSIIFLFAIALMFWTPPVAAETYTVKMGSDTGQLKFVPENLEIKSGDTVIAVLRFMRYTQHLPPALCLLPKTNIFVPHQHENCYKWVMNKVPPHNAVFESDKVPNGDKALADKISYKKLLFAKGDSFETTFSDAPTGTYPYYCEPHRAAGMVGKIIVKD